MNNRQCSYCGRDWEEENGRCAHCGAQNKLNGIARYDPFYYEGYIVYSFRDWSRCSFEFVFYKGITMIHRVSVPDRTIMELPPADDYMPFVMGLIENQQVKK